MSVASANGFDPSRVPADAAVYLHVPFCSAICDFCAFDKALPSPGDWKVFRDGLEREWNSVNFAGAASSVFWGGGTPGLLKASDIRSIGGKFREALTPGAEWTVELTPLCPTREKLSAWREVGVNRISLGVQSFSPRLLEAMGRPYSTEKIPGIVDRIRESGFERLNLDLIIAFPGQTERELIADLEAVVGLAPDHISLYCLTLEEDTALYTRFTRSGHRPDMDKEAERYELGWAFLEEHGYSQYEISNFARPGFQCEHHLNVWRMGNWRGFGPSAASQLGGFRFTNPHGLGEWAEYTRQYDRERFPEVERITEENRALEKMVFGLRMNEGVSRELLSELSRERRDAIESFLLALEREGHLSRTGERMLLSLSGRLLADEISRWMLS